MPPQREWFEKDYYKVLGVSESATQKEITKAYRKLARENHPDQHPGDDAAEERFKEASTAYDVLGDETKRTEYDEVRRMGPGRRHGRPAVRAGSASTPPTSATSATCSEGCSTGAAAGPRGGRGPAPGTGPRRGDDLAAELHLSFEDAVHGVTTAVHLTSEAACSRCDGSGAEPGTTPLVCPTCGGRGVLDDNQGFFSFSQPCRRVPGPRCGHRDSVHQLPGVGHRAPPPRDQGPGARRGQGRPEDPAQGPRRPGPQRRPARRPPRHGTGRGPSPVRANGQRPDADRPRHLRRGGPRGRDPRAHPRRRPGQDPRPGRHPIGQGLPAQRPGRHQRQAHRLALVTIEVAVPAKLSAAERKAIETLASVSEESPRAHLGV